MLAITTTVQRKTTRYHMPKQYHVRRAAKNMRHTTGNNSPKVRHYNTTTVLLRIENLRVQHSTNHHLGQQQDEHSRPATDDQRPTAALSVFQGPQNGENATRVFLPAAAETPLREPRTWSGKVSEGSMKVVEFGPKLLKKKVRLQVFCGVRGGSRTPPAAPRC